MRTTILGSAISITVLLAFAATIFAQATEKTASEPNAVKSLDLEEEVDDRIADPLAGFRDVLNRQASVAALNERDRKLVIQSFMRPYETGRWDTVIQNVRKHLNRRDLDEVEALSSYLESSGQTTLGEIITKSRLQLVRSGAKNVPKPIAVESVLIGQQLSEILDRKIDALNNSELLKEAGLAEDLTQRLNKSRSWIQLERCRIAVS